MKRVQHKLSARQVETLKSAGRHSDGGNLFLSINSDGGRRWVFLYRWQGKQIEMGLGSATKGGVSLADARDLARKAPNNLDKGVDPLTARRAALDSEADAKAGAASRLVTFGQLADEHIDAMRPAWSNQKHAAQWEYTPSDTRCANSVDAYCRCQHGGGVDRCSNRCGPNTPETAARLRGRIEAVLNRAKAKALRTGENPAAWRGHLQLLLPKRQKLSRGHHPALPYDQVPCFMTELRTRKTLSAVALEYCILTAARTSEVVKAEWSEIWTQADLDRARWADEDQRPSMDLRFPIMCWNYSTTSRS